MEGRLLLAGIDTGKLGAWQWLAIAYTMIADSVDGMVDRSKVLDNLDTQLATSPVPERETWGTDPAAQAGQRAMMSQAGGPAPLRDPNKPRPKAWEAREVTAADDDHR